MLDHLTADIPARGMRIALVTSRYHAEVTDRLREGAVQAFHDAGGEHASLRHIAAPGAFELIALCRAVLELPSVERPHAVVALGCVITGETMHDQYINQAVSTGLATLIVRTGVPITFGVLTCPSMEHALARAGGARGNKGAEAMRAAIESASIIRTLGASSGETITQAPGGQGRP